MQQFSLRRLKIAFVSIVCTVFLFCICGLFFPTYWSQSELRVLAPLPTVMRLHSLDAYVRDHFGSRSFFVWLSNMYSIALFQKTHNPHVVIGKDDWLYFRDVPDAADKGLFTQAELEQWRRYLEKRTEWFRLHGITFVFVIIPDKQEIYPEYLRADDAKKSYPRRKQLLEYLRRFKELPVIDATETMKTARRENAEIIYYKLGTHWTSVGAFAFYRSFATRFPQFFPKPLADSDMRKRFEHSRDDQLYQMLYLHESPDSERAYEYYLKRRTARELSVVKGPVPNTITTMHATGNPDLPRLLVYHDSFFASLIPFFSEHFNTAKYVRNGTYEMPKEDIDVMRPKLVIQEIVERRFAWALPEVDDWMLRSLEEASKGR